MKRQISNEHILIIPILFFVLGLTVAIIATLFFFNEYSQIGSILSILLMLVFGFGGWYYSTKLFFKVSFDAEFMYFSRFRQTRKIGLEEVIDIKTSVFPIMIFYLNSYIITITYIEFGVKKKIRFLSKATFRNVGSIKGIPHLDDLKESVLVKKYRR